MSERWWRRRRHTDPWFTDFLTETEKTEKMMNNMIHQAFKSPTEREKARRLYTYQFGSLHPTRSSSSQISEEHEPLVDMFTDETSVIIVTELHGIQKESIEVNATEDKLTITVNPPKRRHHQELTLPAKVDPKSSTASYKNGVLEVRLKKLADEKLLIK